MDLLLVNDSRGRGDSRGYIGPKAHVTGFLLNEGDLCILVLGDFLSDEVKLRVREEGGE
jgi:hypothetical protein